MERLIDARSENGEHPSPSLSSSLRFFLRATTFTFVLCFASADIILVFALLFRIFRLSLVRTPNVFSFVRSFVSRLARYRDSLEGVHVTNHRKRKENKRKEIEEKNAKVLGRVPIALCSRFRVDGGRESVEEQTRERESIDPTL